MMKPLMGYQLRYLRFNFIFMLIAFPAIAVLFRGDLLTTADRLPMYVVIISIMFNYYSFLTTHEFRRNLLTLPISAKDIVKTVFLSSIIMITYTCVVAVSTGLITMLFYEATFTAFLGLINVYPIILVIMSVKHYALLRSSDIEGSFGTEMLVYLGVGILFAAPVLTLMAALPDAYFVYYVALLYVLSGAIIYFMYKLCCKHADQLYVITKYKGTDGVHESIHSKQLI